MIWRPVRDQDLAECLDLDRDRVGHELVGEVRATKAWAWLIHSLSFHSAVIESDPPVSGHRIVAFGASVFVSRAFVESELSDPRPGLNSRIIASIASDKPVVLSNAELRHANSTDGLDLVLLYPDWRKPILRPEQIVEARNLLDQSFLEQHTGFRLRQVLIENMDDTETKNRSTRVWTLVSDFRQFYSVHGTSQWREGRSLSRVTREDAFRIRGHIGAFLFQYREPRLHFRETEQRFLSAALSGLTDEELATVLKLSSPTIKKRWRAVFDRVSNHPEIFPEVCSGLGDERRGRQKRHYILAYLRGHPEELRPY